MTWGYVHVLHQPRNHDFVAGNSGTLRQLPGDRPNFPIVYVSRRRYLIGSVSSLCAIGRRDLLSLTLANTKTLWFLGTFEDVPSKTNQQLKTT